MPWNGHDHFELAGRDGCGSGAVGAANSPSHAVDDCRHSQCRIGGRRVQAAGQEGAERTSRLRLPGDREGRTGPSHREDRGRTVGLLCWIADRYVIGRGFEATERLESFLSRFKFDVLGGKIVENDRYYLVEGHAKDPRNDPRAMIGWIDFDQGLLAEGTVHYFWGSIDTKQSYTRMQRIWMLTYQYLYGPRFQASMEILYGHFRFSSH